jgi:hypothetical protein
MVIVPGVIGVVSVAQQHDDGSGDDSHDDPVNS